MLKTLIRTWYILVNPLRKTYWFIFRPKTKGVKCLIENSERFLLTRLGYAHKKWTVPGGGVKKNETWEAAIRREVFEEVGITLGEIREIGEYNNVVEYKRDTVHVFHAIVPSAEFKIDGMEVVEAQWFSRTDFPADRVTRVDKLIAML